jgi:aminotransferase EvaB
MLVPVADPRRALEAQRGEIDAAIARVLDSARYVLGPEHDAFEVELGAYLGAGHCVGVASGTDALELAMLAVGCRPGDEVVTAANAGFYASAAARSVGLGVRYADVDEATLTLSAEAVDSALAPATRAVVVTHLYGVTANIEPLVELCSERGLALGEDCAQAAGARTGGRAVGTFGDAAAFSFYPTKNLAAIGDGGAVVTGDESIAERVRRLRQYGWETKYRVRLPQGRNSRLDELQAAILRVRLPRLDGWNERRREIVARYAEALPPSAGRLVRGGGQAYVAHLAVVLVDDRKRVRAHLRERDVGTDVHYPIADHHQPVWEGTFESEALPVTEHAVEHVVTLPCFPELTDNEVDRVCAALHEL